MLTHLQVQDYGLIQSTALDFKSGMTVITGETGAGKSLLLEALHLVLGGRVEKEALQTDQPAAQIVARFDITTLPSASAWLQEQSLLDLTEPEHCSLRRVIQPNGRSKCYINGILVTQQQLKDLAHHLLHWHGQNQHHELLKPSAQRHWLDEFGQYTEHLIQYRQAYQAWQEQQSKLQKIQQERQIRDSDLHLLEYQVAELETLELGEEELENLEAEHTALLHAESHQQTLFSISGWLSEGDHSVQAALLKSIKSLQQCPTVPQGKAFLEALTQLELQLADITQAIAHTAEGCIHQPAALQRVETRVNQLYDMARKHKVKPKELYEHACILQERLARFQASQSEHDSLILAIAAAQQNALKAATTLSGMRQKAAEKLGPAITKAMQSLNMKGGICEIEVMPMPEELGPQGFDSVCFKVTANSDFAVQPIHKVASGGELARIALCIQLITAKAKETPTLIFDEVDVGVGGQTGALIGQALQKLGTHCQVICITHLPQVAACAKTHLHIKKVKQGKQTISHSSELSLADRELELARMLGGVTISPEAIANARNLLSEHV